MVCFDASFRLRHLACVITCASRACGDNSPIRQLFNLMFQIFCWIHFGLNGSGFPCYVKERVSKWHSPTLHTRRQLPSVWLCQRLESGKLTGNERGNIPNSHRRNLFVYTHSTGIGGIFKINTICPRRYRVEFMCCSGLYQNHTFTIRMVRTVPSHGRLE